MHTKEVHNFLDTLATFRNSDIFNVWCSNTGNSKIRRVKENIMAWFSISECTEDIDSSFYKLSQYYCLTIQKKWAECSRSRHNFETRFKSWLNLSVNLPENIKRLLRNPLYCDAPGTSKGRPQKEFLQCTERTKKRRVESLVAERSLEELNFAAQLSSRLSSHTDKNNSLNEHLSYEEILSLYLDLDLTRRKYNILRSVINSIKKDALPSYKKLIKVRNSLLPEKIIVTETSAEVDLQNLLEYTTKSILNCIPKNFEDGVTNMILHCKWGFDGSSGHGTYKQKFTNSNDTDEFIFFMALVPITLNDKLTNKLYWTNPRPSSSFYCRPIKFTFSKENSDLVKSEECMMADNIKKLSNFQFNEGVNTIIVSYNLLFTMIDGSICNIVSETNSTQTCYICGAKPTDMNKLTILNRQPSTEHYRFGLSTLHLWIRSFEFLLHIAYNLPFKKWQARGVNAAEKAKRKSAIQAEFKNRMGLLVDRPRSISGSSNDGNTARKFFSDPELSASITGVDVNLIKKFSLILRILSCGKPINTETFKVLLSDTRNQFLALYNWYYMPISIHKLLIHGIDIISSFSLPIGQLSEEALEARHKEIRYNRLNHTRKCSRENSNKDLMNVLLITSDPFVTSLRKTNTKKKIPIDEEMCNYIILDSEDNTFASDIDSLNFAEIDEIMSMHEG